MAIPTKEDRRIMHSEIQSAPQPALRVVFVNRYYYPDESATAQLLTDLAIGLSAGGGPAGGGPSGHNGCF